MTYSLPKIPISADCRYIERFQTIKIDEMIADTKWILGTYLDSR
jgi:hypothetical protein